MQDLLHAIHLYLVCPGVIVRQVIVPNAFLGIQGCLGKKTKIGFTLINRFAVLQHLKFICLDQHIAHLGHLYQSAAHGQGTGLGMDIL